MSDSPRVVTAETYFTWDGVRTRLPKGQVLDVPPGSALEAAIGLQNLVPLGAVSGQVPQEPAESEAPPAATEPQADLEPEPEPEPEPEAPKGKAAAKAKAADVTASADLSGSGAKDGT